jgi:hypothetical protein|nr:MAG TPA: hypothetical protein [Caudoviricetes sp.]
MNNMWYGLMNLVLWLGFVLFIVGMDNDFEIDGENIFIWLAERAILGSYLIVTNVVVGLKRAVEVGFGLVTVVIAWINARFWDEEE